MQTVLLIENDPATLVARALVLRSFGYTVLEASSQDEAVHACQEHPEPIRLVVTEDALDDDDSGQIFARLRLLCPQIRAVVVSDAPPSEVAGKRPMPHECAFIQKPFRVDALVNTLRELLDNPKTRAAKFVS